ncbi:MAG: M20/M25/M40 family metallo-hydrolase [Bdellovibrionales bacterium]|nr:M20/M25/M40 family metallo-hydrolase [Bdellovibrionales bacterium]
MKHLLEDAKRLVRLNSTAKHGNEELANLIHGMLQDRGIKSQLQLVTHSLEDVSKRQFNVIGVLGDPLVDRKIRKGLLLLSHLDTFPAGLSENWTETGGDPFALTVKDGKVFGLGTASAKLDFLCKLRVMEKFREKKLKMPIYLVGTCGREVGMLGSRYLIKSLSLNPKYVIVGEPTDNRIIHAHKSQLIYRVSIGFHQVERDSKGFNRRIDLHSFGRSVCGSSPEKGVNAIDQMLDFLGRGIQNGFEFRFTTVEGGESPSQVPDRALGEFYMTTQQFENFKRFFRESIRMAGKEKAFRVELGGLGDSGIRFIPDSVFRAVLEVQSFFKKTAEVLATRHDPSFDPGISTVNLSRIEPFTSAIQMTFDVRLLPAQVQSEVLAQIEAGVQQIASKYPSLNIRGTLDKKVSSLSLPSESQWVQICQESLKGAEIPPVMSKKSTASEAALFQEAGYDAVSFGPGSSQSVAGSPNEHGLLTQIEKAVAFYSELIERTCL